MNADIGHERRREWKIADEFWFADIRNIQKDKPTGGVGQGGPIPFHIGAAMEERAERDTRFAARKPLSGPPPARHFARRRGIRDVHDLQNVTVKAFRQGSRIDIFAAGVNSAVGSASAVTLR